VSPAALSLLFNGTLALLLVITISYCRKLNTKIRQLQDGRSELAEMIARFDQSTERATTSLSELQTVSKKITEALQLKIDKANFLADDLAFLIEKSSKLASQLEQHQKQNADAFRPPSPATQKPAFEPTTRSENPSAHRPAAGQAAGKSGLEQLLAASAQGQQSPSVASIEAMLHKLAAPHPGKRPTEAESSLRTSAERELLNALKTGRG
jgi:uncharacterized phage infection (PIP) family protein YhgE